MFLSECVCEREHTRDVCAEQHIDTESSLDEQPETLDLSPVCCWVDGVLAWEPDSLLCGDGDESPQGSEEREREANRKRVGGKTSEKQMLKEENRAHWKMFIRLWFWATVLFGDGTDKQR